MSGLIERAVEKVLLAEPAPKVQHSYGTIHKIVICQRGFVFAGAVTTEDDYIVIRDAVNIRRWGTTKGLGELAERGSLENTKADPAGTVRVHSLAVVAMLDCKERIDATS